MALSTEGHSGQESLCFETVLECSFTEGRQASVNFRSSLKNNLVLAFVPCLLIVNVLSGKAGETV